MPAAQQPRRLRRGSRGVLDRLRFVENDIVELELPKGGDVSPQRAIRRDDEILIVQLETSASTVKTGVIEDAQLWCEALRFLLPVKDKRSRHHDERRPRLLRSPSLEQRENLHGLTEAHVVGQTAAETEAAQKMEPAKPFTLIRPQLAAKGGRLVGGFHTLEALELGTRSLESLVCFYRRQSGQQGV